MIRKMSLFYPQTYLHKKNPLKKVLPLKIFFILFRQWSLSSVLHKP